MSQDIRPTGDDNLPPSSFGNDPSFYNESWLTKLGRRMREEPLIPLGCLATCYALYRAQRASRHGKSYDVNRFFRARIYAQGFTLLAVVGGSYYYQDERMKRKNAEKLIKEREAAEKREKWLKELEVRDQEDKEWRSRHEDVEKRAREAVEKLKLEGKGVGPTSGEAKSVIEEIERRGVWAELWRR